MYKLPIQCFLFVAVLFMVSFSLIPAYGDISNPCLGAENLFDGFIKLIGTSTIIITSSEDYVEYGATTLDDSPYSVVSEIKNEINVYHVCYISVDLNGITHYNVRTVYVLEIIPNTYHLAGDDIVHIQKNDVYVDAGLESNLPFDYLTNYYRCTDSTCTDLDELVELDTFTEHVGYYTIFYFILMEDGYDNFVKTRLAIVEDETGTETVDTTTPVETKKKSSGGGCSDCTPPTLGLDDSGKLLVNDGITINGHSEDGGYFHTDYPMQYTELGKTNNVILKYYENSGPQNIEVVQLGLGVKEIGTPINDSEVLIEVHMDYFGNDISNPIIEKVIVVDPKNIISDDVNVTVALVTCSDRYGANDKIIDFNSDYNEREAFYQRLVDSTCLSVDFEYTYSKIPDSWILGSNAWDYSRNTINNYFNDGLTVIDPTPQVVITESIPESKECNSSNVLTRNSCNFSLVKDFEILKAEALIKERYGITLQRIN